MINKNFWKNKTVAVTGSSGFVGSAIVKKLHQQGISVIEISRRAGIDVTDFKQLKTALQPADYIISTAAIDGNNDYKKQHSSYILEENIHIISSVLAAASQLNIHDLTLLSSASVYGQSQGESFSEDYDLIKHGNQFQDGYALSKRITESLSIEFAQKYGGKVLLPRPTNIYSSGDPHKRVIETLSERIKADQEIQIWGDGTQLRSFIYLDDFVAILLRLIELKVSGPINIAGLENTQVIELAQMIGSCLNKKPMLAFIHKEIVQPDIILNTAKLESFIQYDYTSLKDGLVKSIT